MYNSLRRLERTIFVRDVVPIDPEEFAVGKGAVIVYMTWREGLQNELGKIWCDYGTYYASGMLVKILGHVDIVDYMEKTTPSNLARDYAKEWTQS